MKLVLIVNKCCKIQIQKEREMLIKQVNEGDILSGRLCDTQEQLQRAKNLLIRAQSVLADGDHADELYCDILAFFDEEEP